MSEIDVILTDLGGVIFKSAGIRTAAAAFLNTDSEDETVKKVAELFVDAFVQNIDEGKLWGGIARLTNHNPEEVQRLADHLRYTINDQYLRYLRKLSKEYKIGIVSDNNSIIYGIIKRSIPDFDEIFDRNNIFLSYMENDSKYLSGSRYFDRIVKKINIEGERILLIDDQIDNINNAKKSGMRALQYIRTESEENDNRKIFYEVNQLLDRGKDE